MQKLVLVDGSSLLSTNFFATAPMSYMKAKTEEELEKGRKQLMQINGLYTNGVYGMMKELMKIIREQRPTHLCVAWDLNRNTFRRKIYPDYKANRGETKPELKSQFHLAQEILEKIGIKQYVLDGFEADDIIGTLSSRFGEQIPTFILTKDQDALQLVNEYVRLWYKTSKPEKAKEMYQEFGLDPKEFDIPDGVFEFTPLYVQEVYGLTPIQIIDKKALEGDTSDNIPGVKGVGEASVIPLLQEFGTVEGVYDFIETNDDATIKDMIKSLGIKRSPVSYLTKVSEKVLVEGKEVSKELVGKESAEISKLLATIKLDIESLMDLDLNEMALNVNEVAKREQFERLAFKSLLDTEVETVKEKIA